MVQDAIQNCIGSFGRYQLFLCITVFFCKIFIAFHQMAIIFLAPKVDWKCSDTDKPSCPCSNPIYNKTVFPRTIITEWNLICDRFWMVSFAQMLFQTGTLVGSVVFGMASDRFGRRKPLLVACVMQIVAGIVVSFIPEYWSFNIVPLIVGLSVGGAMVVSFVLVMEFMGTEYRDTISALYQLPFNLGHVLLPVCSYFWRPYTKFLLSISIPSVLMLGYFVSVSDTPRWLISVKRTDDAIRILERIAKINKLPTENIRSSILAYQAEVESHNLKKGTVLDLFRTPNLRKNIICMAINWLGCSYCFYGVSQYIGHLGGNVFVNVASSACVVAFGTLISIPMMKVLGRRSILIIMNFICAGCLIVEALIPGKGIFAVIMASVGVVSSFITFVLVYLYCGELFPTVVRTAAMGVSSMSPRIGSMVAPYVIDLKRVAPWLPPVGFAIIPFIAGVVTFFLPETKGCKLMTTIEEGEQFGKKPRPQVPQSS